MHIEAEFFFFGIKSAASAVRISWLNETLKEPTDIDKLVFSKRKGVATLRKESYYGYCQSIHKLTVVGAIGVDVGIPSYLSKSSRLWHFFLKIN